MENKKKQQLWLECYEYLSDYEKKNSVKVLKEMFNEGWEARQPEIDELNKRLTSTELADIDGNLIRVGNHLVDINNGNKYNVFRVKGGFAINTHQNDYNRNTPFYTSIADMQTASYINGNCRIFNPPKQTIP